MESMDYPGIAIAGTYNQYRNWLREFGQQSVDWKYVGRLDQCFGFHNVPILLIGTAEQDCPKLIKNVVNLVQG